MAIFEEVRLAWKGEERVIPPERVLRAIAKAESVVTLQELAEFGLRDALPLARISEAYGVLLRYAGFKVTDDDVYAALFDDGQAQGQALALISTLQQLMVPPKTMQKIMERAGKPSGKPVATTPTAAASSPAATS